MKFAVTCAALAISLGLTACGEAEEEAVMPEETVVEDSGIADYSAEESMATEGDMEEGAEVAEETSTDGDERGNPIDQ